MSRPIWKDWSYSSVISEWWGSIFPRYRLALIAIVAFLIWLALNQLQRHWIARHRTYPSDQAPTFSTRAASAVWVTVLRALPLSLSSAAVIWELQSRRLLPSPLRAYLSNINNSLRVRSDLGFSILNALRAAEIEIPFPQHDIHFRDLDRLKSLYERFQEQKRLRSLDEN